MAANAHPHRMAFLLAALLVWQGCLTTTSNLRQARELYTTGDYDRASEVLQKAAAENPRSEEIKTLLFRAQLGSYLQHRQLARARVRDNDRAAALREYQQALAVFPGNRELQAEYDAYVNPRKAAAEKPQPAIVPPVQLRVRPDEKVSLSLRNTPISNIFKSLGRTFGVNFIFDKDFRDFLHSLEIENSGFYEILRVLCMVSSSQYRVLDPTSVIVYPDIFAKKKAFDLRGIKTFYLSDIKAEDARKLVQTVFRDEQLLIQEDPNLNALVIRGDFQSLADVERFLGRIDKGRSEVEVHIEILEINRTLISKLGADFASGTFGLAAGVLGEDGKVSSTLNVEDLGSTNFFMTIPTVAMNFLESDSNNKILAKPNLRGLDGEEISFMVGDEVPIPETQFQAIAAGGINSSPVTTYRYRNVGVEIKVTPFVHQNNEVTLKTKLTINFISSGATSSFPTFGKREIENKIRLKEGETNIIGGLIRDDIRGSINGIPLLSKIPLLGKLFGRSDRDISQTDLIFSITPKVIRRTPVSAEDNQAIWSGGMQPGSGLAPMEPGRGEGEGEEPPTTEAAGMEEARAPEAGAGDRITIDPAQAALPANSDAFFTVRIESQAPLASLALRGSISGAGCEILEVNADALSGKGVKVLKNVSGNGFDLGLSLSDTGTQALAGAAIQVKAKFGAKGRCQFTIGGISAYDAKRNRVPIAGASCPITVE
ncbi:MAG TPA: hypothetical protein PK919_06240 [Candidatus Aminicenantes bacterium]|nr:hypothetical protein [Candidatus Aminicenantes bacterium]